MLESLFRNQIYWVKQMVIYMQARIFSKEQGVPGLVFFDRWLGVGCRYYSERTIGIPR